MATERVASWTELIDGSAVLRVRGTLDSLTYRELRDGIVQVAVDEPRAVIVDVTELTTPTESAFAVFTSARWLTARWPDVPLLLVCSAARERQRLICSEIIRSIRVFADVHQAVAAVACRDVAGRRRMRLDLPPGWSSVGAARQIVKESLAHWSRPELTAVAKIVVTALVENALQHAGGARALRLGTKGDEVMVAVEDTSAAFASFKEQQAGHDELSSLKIIDAICRAWGCCPTTTGKVVWCTAGPENVL